MNRPLVPFPEILTREEKSYYRPFLFQAKGEEQADDLVDIQAMRMYEDWGARLLVQNILEKVTRSLSRAEALALRLREGSSSPGEWELLGQRLAALQCLVRGADDIVQYQAQLDRVKASGGKPDPNPVLGAQSGWDRTDLMRLARNEIDSAMRLRQWLLSAKGPLPDLAPTPGRGDHSQAGARSPRAAQAQDGHHERALGGLQASLHHAESVTFASSKLTGGGPRGASPAVPDRKVSARRELA